MTLRQLHLLLRLVHMPFLDLNSLVRWMWSKVPIFQAPGLMPAALAAQPALAYAAAPVAAAPAPLPAPAEGFATARALRRLSGTGLNGEDRATLDTVRVRLVALARRLAEASDAGAETGPEATPGKSAF